MPPALMVSFGASVYVLTAISVDLVIRSLLPHHGDLQVRRPVRGAVKRSPVNVPAAIKKEVILNKDQVTLLEIFAGGEPKGRNSFTRHILRHICRPGRHAVRERQPI